MIKLMVVGGKETVKIVEYLKSRGSFNIEHYANSFVEEEYKIKSSIIRVDKLVFIHRGTDNELRKELHVLDNLLSEESFFTVDEIIFIQAQTSLTEKISKYFNVSMANSNFTNYTIKTIKGSLAYSEIYNLILGVTTLNDSKSSYKKVYLRERDSDSNKTYLGEEANNKLIELFSYVNLDNYEKSKNYELILDKGSLNLDEIPNKKKLSNPNFGRVDISKENNVWKTFVVTGEKKTGKSIWSTLLSLSAKEAGNRVLLIDFSNNLDITPMLNANKIDYKEVSMLSVVRGVENLNRSFTVCSSKYSSEREVQREFLYMIYNSKNIYRIDKVIIVCELDNLQIINESIMEKINKLFLTFSCIKEDVVQALPSVIDLSTSYNTTVLLNRCINTINEDQILPEKEIKSYMPNTVRLVSPIFFDDLEIDESLNNKLLEDL